MKTTGAGYARVSTEDQAHDGHGLDAQKDSIRGYFIAQGWAVAEMYADAGRSGKSIDGREGLAQALDDAKAGRFQYLVVWKLDRLARNLRELLIICDLLESAGVGLISINEHIDMNTSAGRMMRNVMGSVAEFEREITVERIEAGLAAKARKGELLGPLPLGYVRAESGDVVVDPAVAPLIVEVFQRYATGVYSLREMADWAADAGLKSRSGRPLDRMSVRKILRNMAYTGRVALHARSGEGETFDGIHPKIIDDGTFEAVRQTLAQRRRFEAPSRPFGKLPYPLSGATCAYCGTGLTGCSHKVDGKYRYEYYRCSTAHRRGRHACDQPMVRAQVLEDQMAAYLGGMVLPTEYLGEVVDELRQRERTVRDVRRREQQARRELERCHRLFVLGEIDGAELKTKTAPLHEAIEEFTEPPAELDAEKALAHLRDIGPLWSESPRAMQREFVWEVFESLEVRGKEIVALTPKPQYAPLFVLDRRERFGQRGPEFCNMAPRAGLEPTT